MPSPKLPGMVRQEGRRGARGVTLLELLIVVAILGIAAALSVPNLMPTVQRHRLYATTLSVSGFVDGVRRRAVAEGRCTRIREVGSTLVAERRASSDCVHLDRDTALGTSGWTRMGTLTEEGLSRFTIESLTQPAGVTAADHHIVFRPNGRLYGNGDITVTDDGARIKVANVNTEDQRAVVIQPVGRICAVFYGTSAAQLPAVTATNALVCP